MGTTADKLNKLLQTKQEIKQAIIDKGVDISDEDTFASYPEKISSIQGGGDGVNWLDILSNGGTRGEHLFRHCNDVTELDLSGLSTSEMTDMQYMFFDCNKLQSLDLSNFNTSNVTNMTYMFSRCSNITTLDLSSFDTSNVTNMSNMFNNNPKLISVNVSSFDTSNVTDMGSMFVNCPLIVTLDVSNFDIKNLTSNYSLGTAFNIRSLVDFYPPQNINANMSVTSSNALSHDSLLRILNNLMETTTTKKLTLGATNLAKLTDEEKAIATNKGWTLA